MLTRKPHPTDRRARTLEITAAGADLLDRVEPAVQRAQEIMVSGLDAAEAAEFLRLLRKAVEGRNALSRAPLTPA